MNVIYRSLSHCRPSSCQRPLRARIQRNKLPCHRGFFNPASLLPSFGNASGGEPDDSHEQNFHERKILPYSPKQLYELVADVDSYHRFVPYCTSSKVLESRVLRPAETPDMPPVMYKEAELSVGFLAFRESYVSRVTCTPYISVEAVASSSTPLFKKLVTVWRFQPVNPKSPHPSSMIPASAVKEDGTIRGPTLLSVDLSFAFASPKHAAASALFANAVSKMMIDAFEKQCHAEYGRGVV